MIKLNLPEYEIKIKTEGYSSFIFDIVRRKYVVITPEEWVRQQFVHYLINEKNYPISLISVEHFININNLSKRCDIVLFNNNCIPLMIVECKSPKVKISQKTFNQISIYNMNLGVEYLVLTNGLQHFCCKVDKQNNKIINLDSIPDYSIIK